jgi:Yip1 domain
MLLERMIRAARLDRDLYYEVERDRNANGQAFAVVLIVAACVLIGSAALSLQAVFQKGICVVCGWMFWSAIAAAVGTRFGARAGFEDVIRPVAFAQTPGALQIFALVPGIGWPVVLVAWLWTMIASVVAIREALRVDTGKAALVVVATSAVVMVIGILTGVTFGTVTLVVDRLLH